MPSTKFISSVQNDDIKSLVKLSTTAKERKKTGLLVLEGIHLIQMALSAGWLGEKLFIRQDKIDHPEIKNLQNEGAFESISIIDPKVLQQISSLTHAGEVMASFHRPKTSEQSMQGSAILLEDIQDPGNLGTILRSAAAANVRKIYLSKGCVDVFSPKVLRAGMGAHFALAIEENADLEQILQNFMGKKIATYLDESVSLYQQDLTGDIAWIMGNEGAGVSQALLDHADIRVRIPMPGWAESLNVAMATTICLFEQVRQNQTL